MAARRPVCRIANLPKSKLMGVVERHREKQPGRRQPSRVMARARAIGGRKARHRTLQAGPGRILAMEIERSQGCRFVRERGSSTAAATAPPASRLYRFTSPFSASTRN
jgi:hypothetical protein